MNQLLPHLGAVFKEIEPLCSTSSLANVQALPSETTFRSSIINALQIYETKSQMASAPPQCIALSKYAVVALIDELVMRQECFNRHEWAANPLQLEVLGENTAGEQFYQHLELLRVQGKKHLDALEIYFLCLELGFEGKYSTDKTQLIRLKNELAEQIEHLRENQKLNIDPNTAQQDQTSQSEGKLWLYKALFVTVLVNVFLGVGCALLLSYQSIQVYQSIRDNQGAYHAVSHHHSSQINTLGNDNEPVV